MFKHLLASVALIPLAAWADMAPAPPVVPKFVAEEAGVTSVFAGDWQYMVGGGASAFDCSGDGMPDLFTAGGEGPSSLWRNESAIGGALQFAKVDSGLEIDAVTGAYPLDIDNDGITDLANAAGLLDAGGADLANQIADPLDLGHDL